jgi:hypothetical protein
VDRAVACAGDCGEYLPRSLMAFGEKSTVPWPFASK